MIILTRDFCTVKIVAWEVAIYIYYIKGHEIQENIDEI